MNKTERETFDRKVLSYIRAKGTVCANEVARHFKKKWETANSSIGRLVKKGQVFYHPEMGDNPCFYSIWSDVRKDTISDDIQKGQPAVKKQEQKQESNELYARKDALWCRAEVPLEVQEKKGFVCHPTMRGSDLSTDFVRAHIHGQYTVRIINVGTVPSTYKVPNTDITGGWTSRVMKGAGNRCYYGHIKFPDDRTKFKFHSMADKNGHLSTLSVYVHPRYIFHEGSASTAAIEFEQQVKDILNILEQYGWEFGEIIPKGNYSMGYNNRAYAEQMPKQYTERDTDIVHFDSSPGSSSKGCTEAEIYGADSQAQERMEVLIHHPQRILDLEANADAQSKRISVLDSKLDRLIDVAEKNVHLSELNMTFSMGGVPDIKHDREQPIIEPQKKEDVMYG